MAALRASAAGELPRADMAIVLRNSCNPSRIDVWQPSNESGRLSEAGRCSTFPRPRPCPALVINGAAQHCSALDRGRKVSSAASLRLRNGRASWSVHQWSTRNTTPSIVDRVSLPKSSLRPERQASCSPQYERRSARFAEEGLLAGIEMANVWWIAYGPIVESSDGSLVIRSAQRRPGSRPRGRAGWR